MADFFADIDDDDEGGQSGGKLRQKLESVLRENGDLKGEVSRYKARDVLTEKGFTLVKPEDLDGVAASDIEAKAQTIQQERQKQQEDLLRDALGRKGYEGDELEEMLADMIDDTTKGTEEADQSRRVRSLGRVESKPVPRVDPSRVHGYDAIKAGIEQNARKRRRA